MYSALTPEKAQHILALYGSDPKYGRLITNAISGWQRHNIAPAAEIWGVRNVKPVDLPHEVWAPSGKYDDNQCACLVSAALFDKGPVELGIVNSAMQIYNLTGPEIWGLIEGFDKSPRGVGKPGYEIGRSIAFILFSES